MGALRLPYEIEFEDGKIIEVIGDQRDLAAVELQDWYDPARTRQSLARYVAWHAAKRQGKTDLGWPKFNAVVVEVRDKGSADDAAGEGVDPGPRDTSDAP